MKSSELIVLSKTKYRDSDAIINTLNSNNEKMTFYVRGVYKVKSKNAVACNVGDISVFEYEEKETSKMQTLRSATLKYSHFNTRYDLNKQACQNVILEIADKVEEFTNYQLLTNILELIDDEEVDLNSILAYFIAQVMNSIGIRPMVEHCVRCSNTNHICYFDVQSGGFLCSECSGNHLDKSILQLIRGYCISDDTKLDNIKYVDCDIKVVNLLIEFLKFYHNMNIRSYDFYIECLK